jgi:large subunit ribosomal protein L15
MSDVLARLTPPPGSRPAERRVGRGPGSSQGKTCGRGFKGPKARNGGNIGKLHFQGGQTPIQRRLPKRGFRVPFPVTVETVNLSSLERFAAGSTVDEAALRAARLVQASGAVIKILGDGQLKNKLTVKAHKFSKSAAEAIAKAGGSAVVIELYPSKTEAS